MFAHPAAKTRQDPASAERDRPASRCAWPERPRPGRGMVERAWLLQETIGNQATLRLFARRDPGVAGLGLYSSSPNALPRLVVGPADNPLECEADRIAGQVMRTADATGPITAAPASVSRRCNTCTIEDEAETLHRKADGSTVGAGAEAPGLVHRVLRSPGRPLDAGARSYFEPRFGQDLSRVRVHDDANADASARAVGALAYTVGPQIVFAAGRLAPQTEAGRELLAHELVHVLQQSGTENPPTLRRKPDPAPAGSRGKVLFIMTNRGTASITIVTETGSLVYSLKTPTTIPMGDYGCTVTVHGRELRLTGAPEVKGFTGFELLVSPGKPEPSDVLRGLTHVSVMVGESYAPGETMSRRRATDQAPTPQGIPDVPGTMSIPVTFTAIPLDDEAAGAAPMDFSALSGGMGMGDAIFNTSRPSAASRLVCETPGPWADAYGFPSDDRSSSAFSTVTPFATGAGMGLHSFAFGDLSWLRSPASPSYWGPLVPRSGVTLNRTLGQIPTSLRPRLWTYLQTPGSPPLTWRSEGGTQRFQPDPASPLRRPFTPDEMLSIEGLVRRYNANPASLSTAEVQLLREAARLHIGSTGPTAPFVSYSAPGTRVGWASTRRFWVKVSVDPGAALDVSRPNAFNQGAEAITNVGEAEFLVVGDQSGRIISVQRTESLMSGGESWTFRNAESIRWGGRLLLVAGVAYSGYRVASAPKSERGNVLAQEIGGQVGGIGGSALAVAGCIALGLATEGVGLLLCGLGGGLIGGGIGSYVGGKVQKVVGGWIASKAEEAYMNAIRAQGEPMPPEVYRDMDFWEGPPVF